MKSTKVFLGIVSLATGLLVCEALLSWFNPQVFRRPGVWQYDAELGWSHIPLSSGWMVGPEFEAEFRINADGLRDRDYAREKEPGTRRLLIYGDSFVEGWGVKIEDSVTEQLEKRLQSETPGGAVEVINFGVAGYGTDQEYLLFQKSGRRYRPDQVLVFFYANDLANNAQKKGIGAERGYKPYFRVDRQGQLRLLGVPVKKHPFWDESVSKARPWHWRVGEYLYEHWHFFVLLTNAFDPPELDKELRRRFYEALYGAGDDSRAMGNWNVTGRILQAFRSSAAQSGAELVLVYVPSIVQIEEENWRMKRELYGLIGEFDLRKPNRLLSRVAEQYGIPLVDLSEGFQREAERQQLYYRESHWTPQGHALAARLVGDYLMERRRFGQTEMGERSTR